MSITRRNFLVTSSAALAAAALKDLPLRAQGQAPQTRFDEIRRGVGIFSGQGGTIGWLVSPDGVVVVDSQYPETAQVCVDGLTSRSLQPIDALVNTHHHVDHTSGNKTFRPAVKIIVAHANVPELQRKAAVAANTEADQAYADMTFVDTWSLRLGRETISAKYSGPAHTSGDIVVTFEEANIVHMGDLVFNRVHPFVDRPAGASIANWIRILEQVAAGHGTDTVFVHGHGHPDFGVTGMRQDLLVFRDYLTSVLDYTRKGIQAGKSKEEIAKLESLSGFEVFLSPTPWLSLGAVLGVAYEELASQR